MVDRGFVDDGKPVLLGKLVEPGTPLRKFVFIQAFQDSNDFGDTAITFRHLFVSAENADEAYLMGQRFYEHMDSEMNRRAVNDYLIELVW